MSAVTEPKGGRIVSQDFFCCPPDDLSVSRSCGSLPGKTQKIRLFRAGRSVLGREIPAIGLGNLKNAVMFVGATHGLEWLTCSLLIRFTEAFGAAWACGGELAEISLPRVMAGKGLVILPLLNPDGVDIAVHGPESAGYLARQVEEQQAAYPDKGWQANARGVDLNHNFDAGWQEVRTMAMEAGFIGPGPTRYGGPFPHSEPETQAILHLMAAFSPRRLYSFHSQGEEIFWEYGGIPVPGSETIAQTLSALSGYRWWKTAALPLTGGSRTGISRPFGGRASRWRSARGKTPCPSRIWNPFTPGCCP